MSVPYYYDTYDHLAHICIHIQINESLLDGMKPDLYISFVNSELPSRISMPQRSFGLVYQMQKAVASSSWEMTWAI